MITATIKQLKEAVELFSPMEESDEVDTELTFQWSDGNQTTATGEKIPRGLYVWLTEEPGEGGVFLSGEDVRCDDCLMVGKAACPAHG